MRRTVMRIALGLVAVALAAGGCAGGAAGTGTSTGTEAPATASAEGEPVSSTNPALDFAATDLAGEPVTGVEGKVVLWFWAPWCPICRGESPIIATMVADNPDLTFLGVAGLDKLEAMQAFPGETGTDTFRHLPDLDGSIWARFGVTAQPAMALIKADGTYEVLTGAMAPQDLQATIDASLG